MPSPAPKKVAIVHAHRVRVLGCGAGTVAELFVIPIAASPADLAEVFQDFWVEYG